MLKRAKRGKSGKNGKSEGKQERGAKSGRRGGVPVAGPIGPKDLGDDEARGDGAYDRAGRGMLSAADFLAPRPSWTCGHVDTVPPRLRA